MVRSAATSRTALRLEQFEPRDVPSVFNTIHTNPINPTNVGGNTFQQVFSGDFDADGARDDLFFWNPRTGANRLVTNVNTASPTATANPISPDKITGKSMIAASGDYNGGGATNDMFFWDPISGHNVLVLALAFPAVTADNVSPDAIKGNAFTKLVVGEFNTGSAGTELFFWKPSTGRNCLVSDVDGLAQVTNNPLSPADVGRQYRAVVAGNFNTGSGGDELFFWHQGTGNNLLASNIAGIPVIAKNTVVPESIRGTYSVVVAGDLSATAGDELFFWNPHTGRNSLVANVSGPASVTNSPIDDQAIKGNVFSTVTVGAVLDADNGLFFWNPKTGRNWAIDE